MCVFVLATNNYEFRVMKIVHGLLYQFVCKALSITCLSPHDQFAKWEGLSRVNSSRRGGARKFRVALL